MRNFIFIFIYLFFVFNFTVVEADGTRDWATGTTSANSFGIDKGITEIHGRVIYQSTKVHEAFKFGKITKKQAIVLQRDLFRIHQDALNAYRNGQGINQLTQEEVKKFAARLDANQKALDDLTNPPKAVPSPTPEAKAAASPPPIRTPGVQ